MTIAPTNESSLLKNLVDAVLASSGMETQQISLAHTAVSLRAPADLGLWKQQSPHFEFGFVQLRFRVADGAVEQLGDLVVLITFYFVQSKDLAAAFRQFLQRPSQSNSIHDSGEVGIGLSEIAVQRW